MFHGIIISTEPKHVLEVLTILNVNLKCMTKSTETISNLNTNVRLSLT